MIGAFILLKRIRARLEVGFLEFENLLILTQEKDDLIFESKTLSADTRLFISFSLEVQKA